MSESVLSEVDREEFVRRGCVRVRDCFSRRLAEEWTREAYDRLYCSPDDSSTWPKGRMRPPESRRIPIQEVAPKAWQAACELLGGEARARTPCTWGDSFIINFGGETDCGWSPPGPEVKPHQLWHKDGDFFRHFLDSPEQGLLVIAIFSDLEARGGGTHLACDSVGHVARFLAEHPEGVLPRGTPAEEIVARCEDFFEVTGEIGDVFFLHPFMLHTWSINESGKPRFLVNPPVQLREPMRFDRAPGDSQSAVEQVVLRALGVDSFSFTPTAARERIVPDRLAREKKQRAERKRLFDEREASKTSS